jgi:RimJ/RimL family protein N-acetyltransferase
MTDIPLTRNTASKEKESQIRNAVRNAENIPELACLARENDVDALTFLLEDPLISIPIYTLPDQINRNTVANFIERHLLERERGEGLLMISTDEDGGASAYHDIKIWPQWAACELGGAIRRDRQNTGHGSSGATIAFRWLFEVIGIDLICETAALDNVRTARLLEGIGFTFRGEISSKLSGGGLRPSLCWELERKNWLSKPASSDSLEASVL